MMTTFFSVQGTGRPSSNK